MPVTLSSPLSASVAFSGLPKSSKRLPQANTPTNPIRFGMDGAAQQDHIELAQRRMEEGTFSEVPLTPRDSGTGQQNRRHGLDLSRNLPPQNTAPADASALDQENQPEPTAPTIPSRLLIAANGLCAIAMGGIGGSLSAKGANIFQDAAQYAEPEGLVKTTGIATSVVGVGAFAVGMLLVKRAFSLYVDRKEALQTQAQQPSA